IKLIRRNFLSIKLSGLGYLPDISVLVSFPISIAAIVGFKPKSHLPSLVGALMVTQGIALTFNFLHNFCRFLKSNTTL
ncbi:MAG TPA: hypothetical protein VFJ51_12515, partial [Nitrososphaeraceae archaeon]|nr:hypothetical protein [Nitrososphaeraceae archaeon]